MTIALQLTLRPELPTVYKTHLDYREQRALFERIDQILNQSGEDLGWVLGWLHERGITSEKKAGWLLTGFRCALARKLTGMTLRDFTFRLTDSTLLQWFCRCGDYGLVHTPSKSALERLEKIIDLRELENIIDAITHGVSAPV